MKLKSVDMKDFCCFAEAHLDLAGQGLVCLVGENRDTDAANSNGSGKSTVFKALTWCLYGDSVDESKGDEVIRLGAKEAVVTVEMEDSEAGDLWRVVRKRSKGKPTLTILNSADQPVELGKEEQVSFLGWLIGLDFMSFRNSVLYGQNDSLRFTDPRVKDSDRKLMLHRMLKTDIFRACSKWTLEQARELKHAVQVAEESAADRERRTEELAIDLIKQRMDGWDVTRQTWLQAKQHEAEALLESANKTRADGTKIKALKEQIAGLKAELEAAEPLDFAGMEKVIREHETKAHALDMEARTAGAKLEQDADTLEQLADSKCPLCSSPMDGKAAKERLRTLKQEIAEGEQRRNVLRTGAEASRSKAKAAEVALAKAKKALATIEGKRITTLKMERELSEAERVSEHREADKKALKRLMAEMEERREEPNPYQEQYDTAKTKAADWTAEIKKFKREANTSRTTLLHYEFWVHGFSNQGLPSVMLDDTMPFLTERANHYLRILSDGDIVMTFSTVRELKSKVGEMRDEIDIGWTIEGQRGVQPSGGQRKKMEIATDLALMDLVSSREGELDLLLLDEVLDGLDREGRDRVMRLLADVRQRRSSIFVVSHETDLAYEFDRVVRAIKEGGASRLEVE